MCFYIVNGGDGDKIYYRQNYKFKCRICRNWGPNHLTSFRKSTKFEVNSLTNSFCMDKIRVQYKDEEFGSVDLTEEDEFSLMRNTSHHGS